MELRRLLFERRLRQADIIRALPEGNNLTASDVSSIVTHRKYPWPKAQRSIREALSKLGVPTEAIDRVVELIPRGYPYKLKGCADGASQS